MDWRALAGVLSGVISVASTVPYVVATARRSIQPNALAWCGWTLLNGIVFVAQVTAEPSWSAVLPGAGAGGCLIIALVTIRVSGFRSISAAEVVCGTLGVLAIVGWQVTSDPQVALGFAIAASLIMSIPMLVKTARDPFTEPPALFVVFVVISLLSLAAAKRFDFLSIGWPMSYIAFDVTIAAITIRARTPAALYRLARNRDPR
jgi:hypothetical protein